MREPLKMGLVLFLTCGLSAGILSAFNGVTKKAIAGHEKEQRDAALKVVAAGADGFKEVTAGKFWTVSRGGQPAGYVVLIRAQGYSGPITMMCGVDAAGAITGLQILSQTETPGLGTKVTTPAFREQFKGKRADEVILKKTDPTHGTIDAITGATISSRAVTNAVREAMQSAEKNAGGGQ